MYALISRRNGDLWTRYSPISDNITRPVDTKDELLAHIMMTQSDGVWSSVDGYCLTFTIYINKTLMRIGTSHECVDDAADARKRVATYIK